MTEGYLDPWFIDIDRVLFGRDLYAWLAPNLGNPVLHDLMNGAYFSLYLMIAGLLGSTLIWRQQWMDELIFAITFCFYTHYLFFILFPVIGPTDLRPALFTSQAGYLSPLIYSLIQNGDSAGGAFPSSHCAGALLITWYAGRIFGRHVALMLAPVTVLLFISSVYLSMHYAIDAIAGMVIGALFAFFGASLYRRLAS